MIPDFGGAELLGNLVDFFSFIDLRMPRRRVTSSSSVCQQVIFTSAHMQPGESGCVCLPFVDYLGKDFLFGN